MSLLVLILVLSFCVGICIGGLLGATAHACQPSESSESRRRRPF